MRFNPELDELAIKEGWTSALDCLDSDDALAGIERKTLVEVASPFAGTAYKEVACWNHPLVDLIPVDDELILEMLSNIPERCDLDEREMQIYRAWLEQGVRGNTSWMVRYLVSALHLAEAHNPDHNNPIPNYDSPRAMATVFFTDIFNRADQIFDEKRSDFDYGDQIDLSPHSLPIIQVQGERPATLKECVSIFWKIVGSSHEYSDDEIAYLKREFNSFYRNSLTAMQDYEFLGDYGEHEAMQVKGITLRQLSTFMTNVLFSSQFVNELDDDARNIGYEVGEAVTSLSLITQLRDDLLDLKRDYLADNTNIVYGIMADKHELPFIEEGDLSSFSADELEQDHPQTMARLGELKEEIIDRLPERYRRLGRGFSIYP